LQPDCADDEEVDEELFADARAEVGEDETADGDAAL